MTKFQKSVWNALVVFISETIANDKKNKTHDAEKAFKMFYPIIVELGSFKVFIEDVNTELQHYGCDFKFDLENIKW